MAGTGSRPAVVIDNGTGFSKLGYAGNEEPSFVIPTVTATKGGAGVGRPIDSLADLDFLVGDEALGAGGTYNTVHPVRHGQIENWDAMEALWSRCIFQHLRCDPEDHAFLLTEPPMNTPENRELTAEIMFETFNVSGLYIAVQAALALAASWTSKHVHERTLTGTVVDSGDGVTHIIPVAEGYVIGSCVASIPIAGREVTSFVQQLIREREADVSLDMGAAQKIKEDWCYVCPDMAREFAKYDADPGRWFTRYEGVDARTQQPRACDLGYERFLGPEIFFVCAVLPPRGSSFRCSHPVPVCARVEPRDFIRRLHLWPPRRSGQVHTGMPTRSPAQIVRQCGALRRFNPLQRIRAEAPARRAAHRRHASAPVRGPQRQPHEGELAGREGGCPTGAAVRRLVRRVDAGVHAAVRNGPPLPTGLRGVRTVHLPLQRRLLGVVLKALRQGHWSLSAPSRPDGGPMHRGPRGLDGCRPCAVERGTATHGPVVHRRLWNAVEVARGSGSSPRCSPHTRPAGARLGGTFGEPCA